MNQPATGPNPLTYIHEDMDVYDSTGEKIGEVDHVYLGGAGSDAIEQGNPVTDTPDIDLSGNDTFAEAIFDAIKPLDIPDVVKERMLRQGYIRLKGGGLLTPAHFALREHVVRVTRDAVYLNITSDNLLAG